FQAEDGIRLFHVTGVQTCALPIWGACPVTASPMKVKVLYFASLRDATGIPDETVETRAADAAGLYAALQARHGLAMPRERLRVEIGRASCRGSASGTVCGVLVGMM